MKSLKKSLIKLAPSERLYHLDVPIVGLTGGIASGKSTVSKLLAIQDLLVIDADKLVKTIYAHEESKQFITKDFPTALKNDAIHFPTLREIFFKDQQAKNRIETFIYQRLPQAFITAYEQAGKPALIIYDVPLLYEKGLEQMVDLTALVYTPRNIQRARLMERDGHLEQMAELILDQQWDIEDKKMKADFVINNSQTLEELKVEVDQFLRQIISEKDSDK